MRGRRRRYYIIVIIVLPHPGPAVFPLLHSAPPPPGRLTPNPLRTLGPTSRCGPPACVVLLSDSMLSTTHYL